MNPYGGIDERVREVEGETAQGEREGFERQQRKDAEREAEDERRQPDEDSDPPE
jgi:hypothetical protein